MGQQTTENKPIRILLVDGDPKSAKVISQVLTRVVSKPDARSELDEEAVNSDYDLLIVNFDGLDSERRVLMTRLLATRKIHRPSLIMSRNRTRDELKDLFSAKTLSNFLATNEEVDVDDLLVTVQKIIRKDIFGIEKYFVWGTTSRINQISASSEKDNLLRELREYVDNIGIPQRLSSMFHTVADEFISNALYNAPVDASGQHQFRSVSRTQDIQLDPPACVEVKVCCDGRRLGISTRDPFGSLLPDTILEYLAKCFGRADNQVDTKTGGAGLGFYQILDSLSHFVVNISPGRHTEMIGIIDVRGTYKDFVTGGKSFNIFLL